MRKVFLFLISAILLSGCKTKALLLESEPNEVLYDKTKDHGSWTFVSMPDFLNVDTEYPQKNWESSLTYILQSVKNENPDFLTVAGDLVMGHWAQPGWTFQDSIPKYANHYYTAWKNRMDAMGLEYYTSIGDHEIGDNPWKGKNIYKKVKLYKQAFVDEMDMPKNGPDEFEGTAFYWIHNNALFISVDVFEFGFSDQGIIRAGVTGSQLQWVDDILTKFTDIPHKFVIGHTPILGPVRKQSSSGMMLVNGQHTDFWRTMVKHRIDAYLCGEVHAVTCSQKDGIIQIAHGGNVGYNKYTNYMVIKLLDDKTIELEIKEIALKHFGKRMWQTGRNRPREKVNISKMEMEKGFSIVGTVTINKADRSKNLINETGYFNGELPDYFASKKATNRTNKKKD